ncbi:EAL domain-containing protein [Photobacterium phosphoreum]|uniref:EAL domain-containing protein n=1 Tax=Photobacterium phosphoreum TaxID=659 RepID=UPI000696BB83|nr:EAL domain-containing protein [Photobacterium phosphoreum]PQJ90344.1 hypothetical protein BTO21_00900 [Photobacterium phosphoreum]PSV68334.1 hypothetical protein CTM77_17490 [Photobacterium phosphoreum]
MTMTINNITEALLNNEFCFYYQPQVDLKTHKVCGAEALIRWIKPSGEIVSPYEFIPFCEENGFITTLSFYMIDVFIKDVSNLLKVNKNLQYSMNLSVLDLKDKCFLDKINKNQDGDCKLNINYEITETAVNNLTDDMLVFENISLIMDDYGTGYSNLISLINTPFNKIKLDNTLIGGLFDNKKNQVIITETIALAKKLGIGIVAEGVEDLKTYEFLLENGCSEIQGYYISKPLPYDDFVTFMSEDKTFFSYSCVSPVKLSLLNHILWIENITEVVNKKIKKEHINENETLRYIKNGNECDFGQWYNNKKHSFFKKNKHFIALSDMHYQVHLIARNMLNNYHFNDDVELLANFKLLNEKSIILTQEMYALNHDILMHNFLIAKDKLKRRNKNGFNYKNSH